MQLWPTRSKKYFNQKCEGREKQKQKDADILEKTSASFK
jgi:hypothetical protein